MSASLAKELEKHLGTLVVGAPVFDECGDLPNMVVYPLFPAALEPGSHPEMITLSEALRKGVRLSDTGLVGRVHIDNPLPTSIFIGESELFVGPTQARALQISCLVPPHRRAALPVNCVEEGRPTEYQAAFTRAEICPWLLRSFKMEQLARHGETQQHRIWERVRSYLDSTGTNSATCGLHAVFGERAAHLRALSATFPPRPGQVGAICAVGCDLFFELLGEPELLEDRYELLLRSALVEAVTHPGRRALPPEVVREFLADIVEVSHHSKVVHSRSLQSRGRSLVFAARGLSGSALMAGGELLHLSAHKKCWAQDRDFGELIGELGAVQQRWEREHAGLLETLRQNYTGRRTGYKTFKAGLAPVVDPEIHRGPRDPSDATDSPARTEADAPRPLPMNHALHEFFLHLFRRS